MAKGQAKKTAAKTDQEHYRQFVEMAAESRSVWGLWRDGWALETDPKGGGTTFPFWPDERHAQACATGPWNNFVPEPIPVEDFLDQLLPQLARDGVNVGLSPAPAQPASKTSIATLISDLEVALQRDDEES